MSTLITDTDAVLTFTGHWSRKDMAEDIAPVMTCAEVNALAGLLYAIGEPTAADMWVAAHASNDRAGDRHYQTPPTQYVVPVDPMDLLQCDSCQ